MSEAKNPKVWMENIGDIIHSEDGEFFWMLPELLFWGKDYYLASSSFSFDGVNWNLVTMPNEQLHYNRHLRRNEYKDYIGLFLRAKTHKVLKKEYVVKISFKDFIDDSDVVCKDGVTIDNYGFGDWKFIGRDVKSSLNALHGLVKISCVIRRKEDNPINFPFYLYGKEDESVKEIVNTEVNKEKEKDVAESKGVDRLIHNFRKLLNDESGSDVILKTIDHEFRAHTVVLSARSPVFASMFQHDMIEKKTGKVDISDCSTAGFRVFLQFLYTANSDTISSTNVLDLYYIADKYQVDDLKADCVEYMKNTLSVDTFCDVITLSLRHSESKLQKTATIFFCRNIKKIVKTVHWKKYLTENPTHANELIVKAINA